MQIAGRDATDGHRLSVGRGDVLRVAAESRFYEAAALVATATGGEALHDRCRQRLSERPGLDFDRRDRVYTHGAWSGAFLAQPCHDRLSGEHPEPRTGDQRLAGRERLSMQAEESGDRDDVVGQIELMAAR